MTTSLDIDLGTYECTPYECCQTSKIHELLERSQDGFDNFDDIDEVGRPSRRVHLDGESGLEMLNEDQDDSQHVKKLKKKKKGRAANRRRRMASPGEEAPPEDGEYEPGTPYDGPFLVMKQISKMKDMVLLKMPQKVMKMTSRSMLLRVSPG